MEQPAPTLAAQDESSGVSATEINTPAEDIQNNGRAQSHPAGSKSVNRNRPFSVPPM